MSVKVLVINSPAITVSDEQLLKIRELTGATEEEVAVVSTKESAYSEVSKHRSTLRMIILAASWSVSLVNDFYARVIHGTRIKMLAVCVNRSWFPEIKSICHQAVMDSVDNLIELVRSSTSVLSTSGAA